MSYYQAWCRPRLRPAQVHVTAASGCHVGPLLARFFQYNPLGKNRQGIRNHGFGVHVKAMHVASLSHVTDQALGRVPRDRKGSLRDGTSEGFRTTTKAARATEAANLLSVSAPASNADAWSIPAKCFVNLRALARRYASCRRLLQRRLPLESRTFGPKHPTTRLVSTHSMHVTEGANEANS